MPLFDVLRLSVSAGSVVLPALAPSTAAMPERSSAIAPTACKKSHFCQCVEYVMPRIPSSIMNKCYGSDRICYAHELDQNFKAAGWKQHSTPKKGNILVMEANSKFTGPSGYTSTGKPGHVAVVVSASKKGAYTTIKFRGANQGAGKFDCKTGCNNVNTRTMTFKTSLIKTATRNGKISFWTAK